MKFKELYAILANAEKYKSVIKLLSVNDKYKDIVSGDLKALEDLQKRVFLRLKDQAENLANTVYSKLVKEEAEAEIKLNKYNQEMQEQNKTQLDYIDNPAYMKALRDHEAKKEELDIIKENGTNKISWDLVNSFKNKIPVPKQNDSRQYVARGLFIPGNESHISTALDECLNLDIKSVLDFYLENAGEEFLDNVFKGLDHEISFATEDYIKNGALNDEVIKGYMPTIEGNYQQVGGLNDIQASIINKGAEADAKALKYMLGGLTAEDGETYQRRLQSIAMASISVKDEDRIFTFSGTDLYAYKNVRFGVQYIKELMLKTDTFKDSRETYIKGIDFEKVKEDAEKRFAGEIIASKTAKTTADNWKAEGRKLDSDKAIIDRAFENCNNADDFNKAFNKLVLDVVDNKSGISKYEKDNLVRRPKDIAKAATYIYNMYEFGRTDRHLENFGVTPDTINAKCAQLSDTAVTTNAFLKEFNTKLNLYNVDGAELRALNYHKFIPNPKEPAEINMNKNLLSAQAKTEGIVCNSTDPILDDAIFTYSQLKDIHSARPWYFKFIHPFVNYAEGKAVDKMEETLGAKYDLRGVELETRINDIRQGGLFLTAGQLAELKVSNKEDYKVAINRNKERKAERDKIINAQLENIEKYGSRIKPQEVIEKENEVIKPYGKKITPTFILDKDPDIGKNVKAESIADLINRIKGSTETISEITYSKKQDSLIPDESLTEDEVMNYIKSNKQLNERYTELLNKQANALNKKDVTNEEIENAQNKFKNGVKELETEVRKRYTLQKQVLKENTIDIELFIDEYGYEKDHASELTDSKAELDEMLDIDKAKYPDMFLSQEDKKNPEKVSEAKSKALSPEVIKGLEEAHEYNQKIRAYNKDCRDYNKQSRLNQFWDKFDEYKKNNPETDVAFLTDIEPDKNERDMTLAKMHVNVEAHQQQIQKMVDTTDIEKKQEDLNKQLNMELGNNISNINNNVQPKKESKQIIIENKKIEEPNIGELKK